MNYSKKHYIYALLKKNTVGSWSDRIFYIGQTYNPEGRLISHRFPDRVNHIKTHIINKYDFDFMVIWVCDNKHEANERESFLIRYFGKIIDGCGPLANIADGDNGSSPTYTLKQENEIIDNYIKSKLSINKFCKLNGVSNKTMASWLKNRNIEYKYPKAILDDEILTIVKLYKGGNSIGNIVVATGRDFTSIWKTLKRLGIFSRAYADPDESVINSIITKFLSHKYQPRIKTFCFENGISPHVFKRWLRERNIEYLHNTGLDKSLSKDICDMMKNGYRNFEIQKTLNVSSSTVKKHRRKFISQEQK